MSDDTRARDLSVLMTRWPSVGGTDGEAEFTDRLHEELAQNSYFAAHPEHLFRIDNYGDPVRKTLVALVRGRGRRTLVLAGHYDTVSIENYGSLKSLASEPEALCAAMIEELSARSQRNAVEEKTLRDLLSGDFLPGRGLLDMKSGLAAGIVALERFIRDDARVGNLLFVATPDEENRSRGMISLRNALPALAERLDLEITGAINLDASSDDGDGTDGRSIYLGSIGKFAPFAYVVGRPTHAGYPFEGVSAHLIASRIMERMEVNSALSDEAYGEISPAPVCLEARDVRSGYEVTTPAHVWLSFNWLTHRRTASELLEEFETLVEGALSEALKLQSVRANESFRANGLDRHLVLEGRILTFSTLRERVRENAGTAGLDRLAALEDSLAGENDQLAVSRRIVEASLRESGLEGPVVIIGFASLHYPLVHIGTHEDQGADFLARLRKAAAEIEQRHQTTIRVRQIFAGISDMSFLGHRPETSETKTLLANTPSRHLADAAPDDLLSFPTVNIGPWGRDYHQKWERVHMPYTFGVLPDLIYECAKAALAD